MKLALKLSLIFAFLPLAWAQVSVKSYTRSDGTVVSAYTRRAPAHSSGDTKLYNTPKPESDSAPSPKPSRKTAKADSKNCILVDPGFIVCGGQLVSQYATQVQAVPRDSRGRILRSA